MQLLLSRWLTFESPTRLPWSFKGVVASHSNDCNCKCNAIEQCIRDAKSPVTMANGLVGQHNCKAAIDSLMQWQTVSRLSRDAFTEAGSMCSLLSMEVVNHRKQYISEVKMYVLNSEVCA